jgi:hypothetical protein
MLADYDQNPKGNDHIIILLKVILQPRGEKTFNRLAPG